jgi:hypothetical protein
MSGSYYLVICKDAGVYVLATRRRFHSYDAAELYVASISVSRSPLVVLIE